MKSDLGVDKQVEVQQVASNVGEFFVVAVVVAVVSAYIVV